MRKRQNLTDTALRACKPASKGSRYEIMDTERRRLGIRVTDKGHLSFICPVTASLSKFLNVTRRRIGDYPTTSFGKLARDRRNLGQAYRQRHDPQTTKRRLEAEAEKTKKAGAENAFEIRAEEYLTHCKREGNDNFARPSASSTRNSCPRGATSLSTALRLQT